MYSRFDFLPLRTWFCTYVPIRPLKTKPSHGFGRFVFTSQGATTSTGVAAAVPPILLRFPKKQRLGLDKDDRVEDNPGVEAANVLRLVVGCLKMNDSKKSSPGNFEVRPIPEKLATDTPELARSSRLS